MTQYILKIFVTTVLVVAVSEVSKRSTLLGGLLASLPLVSFLALLWLHFETKDVARVQSLSMSIFWLVLPSLAFFLALPALLKTKLNFYPSFVLATALMLVCYGAMLVALKRLGVKL